MFIYQLSSKLFHHFEWLKSLFDYENKICKCNIIYISINLLHEISSSLSTYNNVMLKKKIKERKKKRKKENK